MVAIRITRQAHTSLAEWSEREGAVGGVASTTRDSFVMSSPAFCIFIPFCDEVTIDECMFTPP